MNPRVAYRFLFKAWFSLASILTYGELARASGSCPEVPLTAGEVQSILQSAAGALNRPDMTIAVVDRPGNILGIFRKPASDPRDQDLAVSLARTGAFFSNEQAPLSSRTVRFISGKHFPPGIANTPNAALYGIENTNRGCDLNITFDPGKFVPRAKSVAGGRCNSSNPKKRGCGLGITTGKGADIVGGVPADLLDLNAARVNPGGVPIYRGCNLVGGIGVVARDETKSPAPLLGDHAEFAAAAGASTSGFTPFPLIGISLANLVVFLDGIALPFLEQTTRPGGELPDPSPPGSIVFGPVAGNVTPEGYLLSPRAGTQLTAAEVDQIVQQSIQTANAARAAIRLPIGSRTKMMIAVGDTDGTILAVYRMPDATIFSIDVAIAKARNLVYFSSLDPFVQLDLPGVPLGTAITNRTISFGAQPLFPPGIEGTSPAPFFDLFLRDTSHPCSQGFQAPNANQSGIVFFPGSVPLYMNGVLVGGLGISGDGVEQDDVVSFGGAQGFLPTTNIRADRVSIGGVRLPFVKFNRNPFR